MRFVWRAVCYCAGWWVHTEEMIATVGVGVVSYAELFVIGQTVEIHMKEHWRLRELEGLYRGYLRAWAGGFVWNDI